MAKMRLNAASGVRVPSHCTGRETISLSHFVQDKPWIENKDFLEDLPFENQIDGARLQRLIEHADDRGELTVLMSDLRGPIVPAPHVYIVTTAAGSIRAWVYHKRQSDRLAFTNGTLRVVLYDIRPQSATYGVVNVIEVGASNKVLLTIPPEVVHGVHNHGPAVATFVNMPTRAYDPADPDKWRIPYDHHAIPYRFD